MTKSTAKTSSLRILHSLQSRLVFAVVACLIALAALACIGVLSSPSRAEADEPTAASGDAASADSAAVASGEAASTDAAGTASGEAASADSAGTASGEAASADAAGTASSEAASAESASTAPEEVATTSPVSIASGEAAGIDSTSTASEEAARADSSTESARPQGATEVDTDQANILDPTQRADNSFIYDTSIDALFDQASLYDDKTIQVVGEVIGDRFDAGTDRGLCWIALASVDENHESTTISVLLSAEQADQVDLYGRYGVTGTTLQVRGTFHQACPDHEGLSDIHATNAGVIARGVEHHDKFVASSLLPGFGAIALGFVLLIVFYIIRERTR